MNVTLGSLTSVESCDIKYLTCTGELGILGSTQVEAVGAGHNPLDKSPLEPRHQSRTQLILAAL